MNHERPSSAATIARPPALLEPATLPEGQIVRVDATAIADAVTGLIEDASLILRRRGPGFRVEAFGTRRELDRRQLPPETLFLALREHLLLPALVNAHTHLDLSHLGPRDHEPTDGFVSWVEMIRAGRAGDDARIARCTAIGIELSLFGGTAAVGDIAGAPAGRITDAAALALADSPMRGVSFVEFFGIGRSAPRTIRKVAAYLDERFPGSRDLARDAGVTIGLQPHAPNTVDLDVYRWVARAAAARGLPLSTHLSETREEREFIARGAGPQRDMLERFGIWDESIMHRVGQGRTPTAHLASVLEEHPMLVAHVNDADERAIEILARTGAGVVYCPRASAYFGAESHFGPHRYRAMLEARVNVCLGTDSIVNLDTPDRISVLDEMRLLSRRDATPMRTLLAMGTLNGARGLGLDERAFSFGGSAEPLGVITLQIDPQAASPWGSAMNRDDLPQWLFLREK